jgi:hypothetical protein
MKLKSASFHPKMEFFPVCDIQTNTHDYFYGDYWDHLGEMSIPIKRFMNSWVYADCWGLILTKKDQEPTVLHNSYKAWALYRSLQGGT